MNNPINVINSHLAKCTNSDDSIARLNAVDVRNSCIVSAPAGSGKTELLTQRFLALLGVVKNPDEVLAITFTKKSASEMRDRIFSALKGVEDKTEVRPHQYLTRELANCAIARSNELNWDLLANPNQLRIRTIDSFYASVAKRAPMASRIGGGMRVSNIVEECYEGAVRSLFESLDQPSDWQPHMINLLKVLDNRLDIAQDMLVSLLERREQWLPVVMTSKNKSNLRDLLESDLATVVNNHKQSALSCLEGYLAHMQSICSFASSNLPADKCELSAGLDLCGDMENTCWQSVHHILFTSGGDVRKSATAAIGFPAPSSVKDKSLKAEYKQAKDSFKQLTEDLRADTTAVKALSELSQLPSPQYEDTDWSILESLLNLLPILAGNLLLEFQSFGGVDHTAVSSAAICALGAVNDGPSDISLSLDKQLQHILIDEFQDTNNVQMVGLNLLMTGWEPEDGRSLFCVGDAMQSIYGFRGSNVGLFIDAAQFGVGETRLNSLQLNRNFRSAGALVYWFNQFFSQAFPEFDRSEFGEVSYSNSSPTIDGEENTPVSIKAFSSENSDSSESEAFSIAADIETLTHSNPDDSIAILVRSRSHLANIVPKLKARGISYQAIDIDPLQTSPMVADLKALATVILDPTDRIHWLALLRSPLCGLISGDLLAVSEIMKDALINDKSIVKELKKRLSKDGFMQTSRLLEILASAEAHLYRKPTADIVEGSWLALNGPAAYPGVSPLEHGEQFFDMLRKADDSIDTKTLTYNLSKLYALPASSSSAKVHLLTLHKSKGLEYDHVFIPCCERGSSSDSKQLLAWDFVNEGGVERALLSPGDAINDFRGSIGRFLVGRNKMRTNNELLRLLYVGCTRAKASLHLSFNGTLSEEGDLQRPRRNTFAEQLWLHAGQQIESVVNGQVDVNFDWVGGQMPITSITRTKADIPSIKLPTGNTLEAFRGRIQSNDVEDSCPEEWELRYAHHMGTLLHRVSARICVDGVEAWLSTDLSTYHQSWKVQLNQLGVPAYLLRHFVDKLSSRIQTVLESVNTHWIFENSHDSRSECKFHSSEGVHTKTHIIDRLVKKNGVTWIIDFKSDERSKDENLEVFHQRLVADHKNQLQRYSKVYTEATGEENVRLAVYSFDTGAIVECA